MRLAETRDEDDASPPALWRAAQHLLEWLVSMFGEPCEIVALIAIPRRLRQDILSWLRPVEAIARRLLLAEAAALRLASAKRGGARARRARRLVAQPPDDSRAWRVAFRIFASSERRASDAGPPGVPRRPLPDATDPWPIAERVEAVLRVIEDPSPFARRLARRIAARPARARRLARPPPERPRPGLGDWALARAAEHAAAATSAYIDSS